MLKYVNIKLSIAICKIIKINVHLYPYFYDIFIPFYKHLNVVLVRADKNINNGYPILSYVENQSIGITSQKFSDNVKVYTTDGRIVVEGAEGKSMQVYSVDGQMVYNGKAADLSSEAGLFIVRINNNSYKVLVK